MPPTTKAIHVRARISEQFDTDLKGAELVARRIAPDVRIDGRTTKPPGRTPYHDDLDASRLVLQRAGQEVAEALLHHQRPFTTATDCALALGTLPRLPYGTKVLWLDAHSDYDTPETSTISFLGCMSLAGATGAWDPQVVNTVPFPPEHVVLAGVRSVPGDDFDGAGRAACDASPVTVLEPQPDLVRRVHDALGAGSRVYVHFDPDVLDPALNPVPYGRPGGLTFEEVERILAPLDVIGLEMTAIHTEDPALAGRLADLVAGVLAR